MFAKRPDFNDGRGVMLFQRCFEVGQVILRSFAPARLPEVFGKGMPRGVT